ncbi:MAG TPA: SDR family NAD(P)-dependent oxidoreductase [Bauldia sp.]|nr:SDR family NAD(P)-dependent oxidoreductase [Bauldia sp.]
MSKPLAGRIAVVTGASRGIGHAAALALAAAGAHVVAVARTVGGLEALDDQIKAGGGEATLVPLDLKDSAGIDRLGAAIYQRWGRVDALLGNAGLLGAITPLSHLEPKVWDEVVAVNLTANWRLIRSLDPLLRASDGGRALFVTSGITSSFRPYWGGYAVAKAALEALVRTYAAEIANTRIRANLLNPGPLRTRMRAQAVPGEDPQTLRTPDAVAADIVGMLSPGYAENGVLFNFPDRSTRRLLAA